MRFFLTWTSHSKLIKYFGIPRSQIWRLPSTPSVQSVYVSISCTCLWPVDKICPCSGLTPSSSRTPTVTPSSLFSCRTRQKIKRRQEDLWTEIMTVRYRKKSCTCKQRKTGTHSLFPISRQIFSYFTGSSTSTCTTAAWEDCHNHKHLPFPLLSPRF